MVNPHAAELWDKSSSYHRRGKGERSSFVQAYPESVPLPSSDKRWKLVEATMRRYGHKASSLIEVLHTVQESFGYLDTVSLRFVASSLRLPLSEVYGVATYYHFFSLKPPGEHTCVVCMGTGCYVKGAGNLMKAIEDVAHVVAGETTPDHNVQSCACRGDGRRGDSQGAARRRERSAAEVDEP
jgi:bidirectional [NiFe] hydrogenase diaphorase subunit